MDSYFKNFYWETDYTDCTDFLDIFLFGIGFFLN